MKEDENINIPQNCFQFMNLIGGTQTDTIKTNYSKLHHEVISSWSLAFHFNEYEDCLQRRVLPGENSKATL